MDKFAQVGMFEKNKYKRSPLNKIKEKIPSIPLINPKLNPRLEVLLESLKDVDNAVREKAKELNPLLKAAKTNLNRREYMATMAYLDMFHDLTESIDEEFNKLNLGVDEEHFKFLFEDLDEKLLNQLLKIDPKITEKLNKKINKSKAASIDSRVIFIKEAGAADWWHNITTDRGKTLSTWEKSYPKYTKNLKKATEAILSKSTSYLSFLLTSLKRMDGLRTSKELEDYLKEIEKLKSKYDVFNRTYIDFYKTYGKKYVDMIRAERAKKEQENQKELEELKTRMNEAPAQNDTVPMQPLQNPRIPFPNQNQTRQVTQINIPDLEPPSPKAQEIPKEVQIENEGPPSALHHARPPTSTPEPENENKKSKPSPDVLNLGKIVKKINKDKKLQGSYEEFIIKLSSMTDQHPFVIAKEIILFAQECDDEKIREKLIAVAKKLVK